MKTINFRRRILEILLTKQEREIFHLVMQNTKKSPWHVRINDFIASPSYGLAIDLFFDLKLMVEDVPENMKALIGEELVEKLQNWRP